MFYYDTLQLKDPIQTQARINGAFFQHILKKLQGKVKDFAKMCRPQHFFFLMDSMTSTTHRNTKMHLPSTAFPKIP
jgi:hypothetical protein